MSLADGIPRYRCTVTPTAFISSSRRRSFALALPLLCVESSTSTSATGRLLVAEQEVAAVVGDHMPCVVLVGHGGGFHLDEGAEDHLGRDDQVVAYRLLEPPEEVLLALGEQGMHW